VDGDMALGRRRLLVGAGVGFGALALAGTPTAASAAPERKAEGGLTGSWLVTLTFNPLPPPFPTPPTATAVNSFAAGGAFAAIVLNSPTGAAALGTWESTGDHAYKATVWQTETSTPNPTIALRVSLRGTFNVDHIMSTFTFDVFLPSNLTTPIATGSGTSSGTRIVA
jgi:hypothetical protein